jgi:hypothetical protein
VAKGEAHDREIQFALTPGELLRAGGNGFTVKATVCTRVAWKGNIYDTHTVRYFWNRHHSHRRKKIESFISLIPDVTSFIPEQRGRFCEKKAFTVSLKCLNSIRP